MAYDSKPQIILIPKAALFNLVHSLAIMNGGNETTIIKAFMESCVLCPFKVKDKRT